MWRRIGGAVAGVVAWLVIVTLFDLALRRLWPDYASVEKAMAFTLPMMIARLFISGLSSLASGAAAAAVGRDRLKPSLTSGVVLLVFFIPWHYMLWHRFPIWYHLIFLSSLVILSVIGGRLTRTRRFIFQPA